MSWDDITKLVDAAKLGNREAFGELVSRFEKSIFAYALTKVREPLDAQELTQEVFVHAMRKLPQLRDARCFGGWLRQITARMAINRHTRKAPCFGTEPEILDSVAGVGNDPAKELELTEAKAGLHAGLAELKPDDRATLEAFYLRGWSLKKMAREFEAPVGTIKRRLFVARQRLKEVLGAEHEDMERPMKKSRERELLAV